jgi:hypothetical protein
LRALRDWDGPGFGVALGMRGTGVAIGANPGAVLVGSTPGRSTAAPAGGTGLVQPLRRRDGDAAAAGGAAPAAGSADHGAGVVRPIAGDALAYAAANPGWGGGGGGAPRASAAGSDANTVLRSAAGTMSTDESALGNPGDDEPRALPDAGLGTLPGRGAADGTTGDAVGGATLAGS